MRTRRSSSLPSPDPDPEDATWWSGHPDLEGIARRGRAELQEDAVAAELDNEQLRQRRRKLVDVCFEWMSRGDLVSVAVAGTQFEGRLTAAVNDLIIIATKTIEVAVQLGNADYIRSDRRACFDGTNGDRTASSFRAQLGRFEVDGVPVRMVGVDGSFNLEAVITASTDDHVLAVDTQGQEWALPRNAIGYAIGPTSA